MRFFHVPNDSIGSINVKDKGTTKHLSSGEKSSFKNVVIDKKYSYSGSGLKKNFNNPILDKKFNVDLINLPFRSLTYHCEQRVS